MGVKWVVTSLCSYGYSDLDETYLIRNFHGSLVQLYWSIFGRIVYGGVQVAQKWKVSSLKNPIQPP